MFILHADIEELDSKVLEFIDSNLNIEFKHVKSAKDLGVVFHNNEVDLVIVGEQLEEISGLEVIKRIQKNESHSLKIVYIVNNETDEFIESYVKIGISDCIYRYKFTPSKLKNLLKQFEVQNKLKEGLSELSVAIIDDSGLSLKVAINILNSIGIRKTTIFTKPVDLLKNFKNYDLYLVDIIMPQISGDKLIAMIRKMASNCIIIAMSNIDNEQTISNVLLSGADDYVIKPFSSLDLVSRIKTNYRSYHLFKVLEEKNMELDRLSKIDSLTNAFNHGYIMKCLNTEMEIAVQNRTDLSILLIDLDFFKKVNDSYGHGIGDDVLRTLSWLFTDNSRTDDIFGRYGGEEFLFVMSRTDLAEAVKISNELREKFSDISKDIITDGVTFSGGVAIWDGSEDYRSLVKRADDNLYLAKDSGRNLIIG